VNPEKSGKWLKSPGGSFAYRVIGPICRLYDRQELPWPSCNLGWHSKQPSWNRVGKRFIADIAASRHPSYAVEAVDLWGNTWKQVITLYQVNFSKQEQEWWITKKPQHKAYPSLPEA